MTYPSRDCKHCEHCFTNEYGAICEKKHTHIDFNEQYPCKHYSNPEIEAKKEAIEILEDVILRLRAFEKALEGGE